MFYREAGDFKTSYDADNQTFPIAFDRYRYWVVLAIAFLVVPFVINDYWANSLLIPFLIYAIAAIGLNILTGYCGQVSLGTGAFMAVGAYACYKLMTAFPDINILIHVLLAGGITALVGAAFGLPSLRIKGFYLAVATLAAQFFLVWLFNKVSWFYNYSASGQISAPERFVFGVPVTGPNTDAWATYLDLPGICHRFCNHRSQYDQRQHGSQMDGNTRYGYRRRNYRGEPASSQIKRLRCIFLFRGYFWCAFLCRLLRRR